MYMLTLKWFMPEVVYCCFTRATFFLIGCYGCCPFMYMCVLIIMYGLRLFVVLQELHCLAKLLHTYSIVVMEYAKFHFSTLSGC